MPYKGKDMQVSNKLLSTQSTGTWYSNPVLISFRSIFTGPQILFVSTYSNKVQQINVYDNILLVDVEKLIKTKEKKKVFWPEWR